MKLIPSLAALCALALPCALSADPFEGKVSMKITTSNTSKDGPQSIDYIMKEGFMRIEIATAKGQMSMIMDLKNRQMIMLMPQQQMYMVQNLPQPPAADPNATAAAKQLGSDVQVTTEKETILGYECTKIVSTSPQGSAEVWVTEQLGSFMGLSPGAGGGPGRKPMATQAWESALKGKGYFPMRVVSNNAKGTFRLDVTAVQKESEPDSEFAPPAGWRKFDIGSMMGGAFPGGMPGAKPAGNN